MRSFPQIVIVPDPFLSLFCLPNHLKVGLFDGEFLDHALWPEALMAAATSSETAAVLGCPAAIRPLFFNRALRFAMFYLLFDQRFYVAGAEIEMSSFTLDRICPRSPQCSIIRSRTVPLFRGTRPRRLVRVQFSRQNFGTSYSCFIAGGIFT